MTEIIVTDLTRFGNREKLCLAGLTQDGQTCIRPMPYLMYEDCKKYKILPGSILRGEFKPVSHIQIPHTEDHQFTKLIHNGPATSAQFESVLEKSSISSIISGFNTSTTDKLIPAGSQLPNKSIITLKINPKNFSVKIDSYKKLRADLVDNTGNSYKNLPVTDLGFFDYVGNPDTRRVDATTITNMIHSEKTLYLRIGLSRIYESPDGRHGYWIQVNGIYTFPNYSAIIRNY